MRNQSVGQLRRDVLGVDLCLHQGIAVGREQDRKRQRTRHGERRDDALELHAVGLEGRTRLLEFSRDPDDVVTQHLRVFVHVGSGHEARALDHGLGPLAEPLVEALVQRNRRDDGNDDRRHRGSNGEHGDHAQLQARTRLPEEARLHQQHGLGDDEGDDEQHQQPVGDPDQRPHFGRRLNAGGAGHDQEGARRDEHRKHDDNEPHGPQGLAATLTEQGSRCFGGRRRGWFREAAAGQRGVAHLKDGSRGFRKSRLG